MAPAERESSEPGTVAIPWKTWQGRINRLGGDINLEGFNNISADRIANNIARWIKENADCNPVVVWNHDVSFYQTILKMTQVKLYDEGIELIIRDTPESLAALSTNLWFLGRVRKIITA